MAPELITKPEYRNYVDIYGYAIMALEILTGRLAFEEYNSRRL
jgi:serine/threonine protein kinase